MSNKRADRPEASRLTKPMDAERNAMRAKREQPETPKEQGYREEADRLRQLDRDTQRQVLDVHQSVADDPRVRKSDRDAARERYQELSRLLKLPKSRQQKL